MSNDPYDNYLDAPSKLYVPNSKVTDLRYRYMEVPQKINGRISTPPHRHSTHNDERERKTNPFYGIRDALYGLLTKALNRAPTEDEVILVIKRRAVPEIIDTFRRIARSNGYTSRIIEDQLYAIFPDSIVEAINSQYQLFEENSDDYTSQ
jgi:hypothetical protein